MYRYAAFDPRPTAEAAQANQRIIDSATGGLYGVEVTIPALAAHCGLGNLDPQHSDGQDMAACFAALYRVPPPAGATLATVRPDADALVAMAVLTLRARKVSEWAVDKVEAIAKADAAPRGTWRRDYRPPAVFARVNAVAMNHRLTMAERVETIISWLTGQVALPEVASVDERDLDVRPSPCGRYAVVVGSGDAGRGAMAAGYRLAPVVIGVNPAFTLRGGQPHLKYTIARWNTSVGMDWDGLTAALSAAEPGWGGSTSIIGSPQGMGSTLTPDQVTQLLEAHL